MRVGIALLTCNKLDWTRHTIRTLYKYTSSFLFDLVILDNGSTDETVKFITSLGCPTILQKENTGLTKGNNTAFEYLISKNEYKYIMMIHNDMLFTPEWLEGLISEIEKNEKCLQMSPRVVIGDDILKYTDKQRENITDLLKEDFTARANLGPILTRIDAFEKIGFYDEKFVNGECVDCDYNKRVEDAGYLTLCTHKSIVFHRIALTRKDTDEDKQNIVESHKYFREKHNNADFENWNKFVNKSIMIGTDSVRTQGAR